MVLAIDCAPYILKTRLSSKKRVGALLRVRFDDSTTGYCDCHPWPSLGDPPLHSLLKRLARDQYEHPILQHALRFAKKDGELRALKRSLFDELEVPDSHLLLEAAEPQELDQAAREGFKCVKVKAGKPFFSDVKALNHFFSVAKAYGIKVRLDFNESLTFSEYCQFGELLSPWEKQIDFIEDPFPFEEKNWAAAKKRLPFTLACDRRLPHALSQKLTASVDLYVIKPVLFGGQLPFSPRKRVVITSYLDHPIGQLAAAFAAALSKQQGAKVDFCGLMSHRYYENNTFSQQLPQKGPKFVPPVGYGCGFDAELTRLHWKKVSDYD